jgi:hypothetical protein
MGMSRQGGGNMAPQAVGHPPITLPPKLRLLNALGPVFRFFGLFNIHDDPERYLSWARKEAGLSDFGPYDVRTSLEKLLHMMKYEADLSLFGRIAEDKMIRRNLVNSLLAQQLFATQPELASVDVEEALIIICTPRTGSTLLHNLLAQHPNARAPRMWELDRPCPASKPELEQTDPRIQLSDQEYGAYYRMVPAMRAIHFFAPEAIEECTHLFLNIFTCRLSYLAVANRSSYTDWIMRHDMADAYRAYKRFLQILKLNYQTRFLTLKSPGHILCLDALAEVFPRARIVHLHRDPATAAGSFCSLTEGVQISMRKHVNTLAIGDTWNQFWTPVMLDAMRWRETGKLNVLDVNFRQLISDPIHTVQSIYQHFGLDTPDELGTRITQYLTEHPKDEFGSHSYTLERYGLDRQKLHAEYADYIDYFNVPLEGKAG